MQAVPATPAAAAAWHQALVHVPTALPNATLCPQDAPPDPGMQPKRYTHERARGPTDLHLSAPAAIPGATPGAARADRPRPRAQPLNPLDPAYIWYPVRKK